MFKYIFLAEGHTHPNPCAERKEASTMPQSLTKLYAHLIFSTKNRERWLDDEIRPRVWNVFGKS